MSSFKIKNKKKIKTDQRLTLDAKHNEQMTHFKNQQDNIPKIKNKLTNYKLELDTLEKKGKHNMTDDELDKFFFYKDEIPNLEKELHNITNLKYENDYLLETGNILFKYYSTLEPVNTNNHKTKKNSIMKFLKDDNNTTSDNNNNNQSRGEILDDYLTIVDKNHNKEFINDNININYCANCNIELTLNYTEALFECSKCGNVEFVILDSDKPSYKEPPREVSYFAYKRINHFNEWLAQFQAKESTEIPNEVFDSIWVEIKKERISNMALLTQSKVREILKKLRLNKYYEHVPHIINRLNGLPAPIMNRETEEKLRNMFKEIQIPFLKYCPKDRKNFLSYSYVLHKFVQLLGYDQYLVNFPLLKSREKLHQQDIIWKEICDDLKWEFIRSI